MNTTSFELYLEQGPRPGAVYPLTDEGMTIGRDPLSDILINDPEVSRQHALVKKTATGDYYIQDLGSTNGTYVNGRRLGSGPVLLQPSSVITMGGAVTFVFRERENEGSEVVISEEIITSTETADRDSEEIQVNEHVADKPRDLAQDELKAANENISSYPESPKPVVYYADEELYAPSPIEADSHHGISPNLLLGIGFLLLCSCASLLVFLMYLGGDWFFREIGLVP